MRKAVNWKQCLYSHCNRPMNDINNRQWRDSKGDCSYLIGFMKAEISIVEIMPLVRWNVRTMACWSGPIDYEKLLVSAFHQFEDTNLVVEESLYKLAMRWTERATRQPVQQDYDKRRWCLSGRSELDWILGEYSGTKRSIRARLPYSNWRNESKEKSKVHKKYPNMSSASTCNMNITERNPKPLYAVVALCQESKLLPCFSAHLDRSYER
jgi:hypothetical protein